MTDEKLHSELPEFSKSPPTYSSLHRISWRMKDTGVLRLAGYGMATNYDADVNFELVDTLNFIFPSIEFIMQRFDNESQMWIDIEN